MDGFQRAIVSGVIFMITVSALITDWLTDIDIPAWLWMAWLVANAAWLAWIMRVGRRDTKRFEEKINLYLQQVTSPRRWGESAIIGGESLWVHSPSQCAGEICCVHNPSDHKMRTWSQIWREDKKIMERICRHGVGHPDPDDVAYRRRTGMPDISIHGCDACCMEVEL